MYWCEKSTECMLLKQKNIRHVCLSNENITLFDSLIKEKKKKGLSLNLLSF